MTVGNLLTWGKQKLKKNGINSYCLDSETLLSSILSIQRLTLNLEAKKDVLFSDLKKFVYAIKRRCRLEPIQYILGYQYFFGRKFFVNSDVLIPRMETEILVDTIISDYKNKEDLDILDIGTGSGNIAITLYLELDNPNVIAVDNCLKTLKVSQKNNKKMGAKVKFKRSNIFDSVTGLFDIIVSNPPYLNDGKKIEKQVKNFEPHNALFSYGNDVCFYEEILKKAKYFLKKGGRIYFEVDDGQARRIKNLGKYTLLKDLNGYERVIIKKGLNG